MTNNTISLLQSVSALDHFAAAFGVKMPDEVAKARKTALDLQRTLRTRPAFDMRARAVEALDGDLNKVVAKAAKDKLADEAEREVLQAVVSAAAERAVSAARAAAYDVIEAAMTGPRMQKAAEDLRGILADAGDVALTARPEDYRAVITHARLREVEAVAEELAVRTAALPGVGREFAFPVLMFFNLEPALRKHSRDAVRASARGITGGTDIGAWQREPLHSAATFRPVNPRSVASLLLARRGATVELATSLEDIAKREALVEVNGSVSLSGTDRGFYTSLD